MSTHRRQVREWFAIAIFLASGVATLALWAGYGSAAESVTSSVGSGAGENVGGERTPPCNATLLMNGDDEWENGIAWRYGGEAPPDYGSFAEGYTATGTVCGTRYHLTSLPNYFQDKTLDAYVYSSDGYNPLEVLSVATGVVIDPPAIWPQISVHDVDVPDVWVDGQFFVSYWGNWPWLAEGWYCAVDYDNHGMPRTNIAPGIGYPTGWQNPEIIWPNTHSVGCDAYVSEGPPPTPARSSTWGAIKNLY